MNEAVVWREMVSCGGDKWHVDNCRRCKKIVVGIRTCKKNAWRRVVKNKTVQGAKK